MARPSGSVSLDDAVLSSVLVCARAFVRRLNLPTYQHDDIAQDVVIVAHRKLSDLQLLNDEELRRWTRGVTFLVMRNTKRAAIRRSAAWARLRDALDHEQATLFGTGAEETAAVLLSLALGALTELDRKLLVGQVWDGCSIDELAGIHHLTPNAVRLRLRRSRLTARKAIETHR
jgi:DNA-directed RNA polymerase specialized sigma24 family protein